MTLLAWCIKNWRLVLAGGAALLVVLIWAYVTHLQHVAKARKVQLQQAAQTLQVQTKATEAADHVATQTVRVEERTHEIIRTIHAAPGASDPVPPAVLAGWRDGLRDAGSESSGADTKHPR